MLPQSVHKFTLPITNNKKILEASRELVSLSFAAAADELRVGARVMNWLM